MDFPCGLVFLIQKSSKNHWTELNAKCCFEDINFSETTNMAHHFRERPHVLNVNALYRTVDRDGSVTRQDMG